MKRHLFLLIGQSNMAGFGPLQQVKPIRDPRIEVFRNGTFIEATEPLHQDHNRNGIGLGMSFAKVLADHWVTDRIGLIPCAVSGTAIRRWAPGADLYQRALRKTQQALPFGTLRGVLWLQGEADAATKKTTQNHSLLFEKMVHHLRGDLGDAHLPFLSGGLGDFLAHFPPCRRFDLINQQYQHAALTDYAFVPSVGLKHMGDGVHFDSPSLRTLGERFAQSYLQLTLAT
ncbi:MAG: sialate O-acetylesterase [Bacteroidetes Order II. Incertae sedis bacterium]|nr:sialate O-acetylesterase [Bacteroidetes Order II. bacterium]